LAFLVGESRSRKLRVTHFILQVVPEILDRREVRRCGGPVESRHLARVQVVLDGDSRVDGTVILLEDPVCGGFDPRHDLAD